MVDKEKEMKSKLPEKGFDIEKNLRFLNIPGAGGVMRFKRQEPFTQPLVEGLTPSKEEITDAYMESLNEKQ